MKFPDYDDALLIKMFVIVFNIDVKKKSVHFGKIFFSHRFPEFLSLRISKASLSQYFLKIPSVYP